MIWCGLCVGLLLISGACRELPRQPASPAPHGAVKQAIIGGKPDLRHPAVGGLIEAGHTFCTATLIATKLILTAAHCIDGKGPSNKINFRIDVPSQSSASGFQSHYYELDSNRLKPHPRWNGSLSGGHDIAVALLKTAVPPTIATPMWVNTAPLNQTWVGKSPLFMGFGLIESDPNAISPDTKHAVNVPIIIVRNDEFLTQGQGVSTCHGDSGGPALDTVGGRFSVIGVNSYSQSARVPGSNPPRTKCDGRNGVARTDAFAKFVQSMIDQFGDAPGSCQSANDCSHCDDCNTSSTPGQCQRKASLLAPSSCKPCTTSADCGGGVCHRFDQGFRCMQRCPTNGCCPSGTQCQLFASGTNEDWFCVPNQARCPDISCQSEQDCGPGELCTAGTCAPKRPPRSEKLCHPCSSHDDCPGDNAYCMGPQGSSYCAQACGDADFCPQGTTCQQPYKGTPKQCLAASGCPMPCTEDKDCPTDFTCQGNQNKYCARNGGGQQGDFCEDSGSLCAAGLACIQTLDGKRCMKPCGVPKGEPGSLCLSSLKCNGDASCYSVAGVGSTCILQCDADSTCNGGPCFNRVCKCTEDKDCKDGFFCNKTSGLFPTCVSNKLNRTCDAGYSCQAFGDDKYCVAQVGSVAYGQPCDAFHRCRPGLACIEGKDGNKCLEDCTKTRGCSLGGECSAPNKDGIAICVCKRNRQCSSGSSCSPTFYLGEFGYCIKDGASTACTSRLECPAGYTCEKGGCVVAPPAPEVPEEPAPEPQPEPIAKDEPPAPRAEPEPASEPPPEPEPTVKKEPTAPDAGPKDAAGEANTDGPGKGCGCATTPPGSSLGLWLLLLLLAWGRLYYSHSQSSQRYPTRTHRRSP